MPYNVFSASSTRSSITGKEHDLLMQDIRASSRFLFLCRMTLDVHKWLCFIQPREGRKALCKIPADSNYELFDCTVLSIIYASSNHIYD
jgi:hypothetical protein